MKTSLASEFRKATEKATGRRFCAGHNAHLPLVNFKKHQHFRKCDICVDKTRSFEDLRRARK